MSSSPALGMKAGWVTLGQSLSLSPRKEPMANQETESSSPALGMKAGWVTLGQSLSLSHRKEPMGNQETVSSSPALGTKAGWVTLGQSLSLSPTHLTGLLLWGKEEEEGVLGMFIALSYL